MSVPQWTRLRWRLATAIATTTAIVFGSVATFLLMSASDQRNELARHALERAQTISETLDREIASHLSLLKGLSSAPTLAANDLGALLKQLKVTPVPVGTALLVWDEQKQLLNTRVERETSTQRRWTDFDNGTEALQRLRENGYSISNKLQPKDMDKRAEGDRFAIAIRAADAHDGQRYLSALVPTRYIGDLLEDLKTPKDWLVAILGRDLKAVYSWGPIDHDQVEGPATKLHTALQSADSGQFYGTHALLVSYAQSDLTGWTVAVKVPVDVVDASWKRALQYTSLLALLLAAVGIGAAKFMTDEVTEPLRALTTTVDETKDRLQATADNLLRAEARYETFWRHMPEGLFAVRVTKDQRFVYEGLNPVHERLSGISQAELANKEPHACLPPHVAEIVTGHYRDCIRAGTAISYEQTLDLPGGRRRMHTFLAPVADPVSGRTFLIVGSSRDVTHERDARDSAERARRLLQRIMDTSPDVIYVYNVIGKRFAFLSGRVSDVLAYTPDEFRHLDPLGLESIVHPDDWTSVASHLAGLSRLADGEVSSHEFRIRGGDGVYRWFRSKDAVFSRAGGQVSRVVGVARNIDHAKRAEQDLKAINGRLATILASISDCYLTVDHEQRVTDINLAALEWLQLGREKVIGETLFDLSIAAAQDVASIRAALLQRSPVSLETRSAFNHGRWLDLHIYPSPDGAGSSLFFRDITERKTSERVVVETKELLQSSLDALSAHIAILDGAGGILAVNTAWRGWAQRYGFEDADVGYSYVTFCERYADGNAITQPVAARLRSILSGEEQTVRSVYRSEVHGQQYWFQWSAARFDAGGAVRIVVSNEDVTDVNVARQAVNELSQRLLALQEEERQRLAQELHDSTAQHLVAASLNIMSLKAKRELMAEDSKLFEDVESSLEEASKELRVFTYLLHPPNLESDGLKASLASYIRGFADRTGLKAKIHVADAVDGLPISLQRTVLRVIQEALGNVHRHAGAASVSVALRFVGDELKLEVKDNGRGICQDTTAANAGAIKYGLGIPGMRARLHQHGGSLVILSGAQGTTIRATIPRDRWQLGKMRAN